MHHQDLSRPQTIGGGLANHQHGPSTPSSPLTQKSIPRSHELAVDEGMDADADVDEVNDVEKNLLDKKMKTLWRRRRRACGS